MPRLLVIVVYLEVWKSGVCDATPAHVNQDVNEGNATQSQQESRGSCLFVHFMYIYPEL